MQETQTIYDLQKLLAEKISKIDEENRIAAEAVAKERAIALEAALYERRRQLESLRAAEEKAKLRKIAEQEAEQKRIKEEREVQLAIERKQNKADEEARKAKEELQRLKEATINTQFIEEQNRKAMENSRVVVSITEDQGSITGEAAEGTDGSTPVSPLMSGHLKSILRQSTRSY